MFCRNCGHQLADGDKFCSSCGAKNDAAAVSTAPAAENVSAAAPAEDKPIFEPFDFKAFGFDFSDLGLGLGTAKEEPAAEESKPTPPTEEFNWNIGAFPDRNTTSKTEDVNFNWSLSPEEVEKTPEPEIFTAPEPEWTAEEPAAEDTKSLEDELFGDIGSKADETRKQSEEIDKFFTFHKKNEEFQKILDREYEKVKTGNIITEEMNAAEAVSEEKFTARQPEDPMEALFAAEGVIKGYEPKPVETDVLDRIEAAEEEKRIREEAERIAAEERAKMAAEEAAAEAPVIEEPAEAATETVEVEPVAEEPAAEESAEEIPAEAPAGEEPAAEASVTEEPAAEASVTEEPAAIEEAEEPVQEEAPEKTKQVDKAAILAGMTLAAEMVERDKAFAAAQAEEAAAAEEVKIPDFLGHAEEPATEEPVEEAVEEIAGEEIEEISVADVMEAAAEEEPAQEPEEVEELTFEDLLAPIAEEELAVVEEEPAEEPEEELPELELDIFEQLEAVEAPAEEIVLTDSQTIGDLFAEEPAEEEAVTEHTVVLTEDSVAEILKTVEEDTTKDDTMVFTAHALGALLAEAEQTDPDAKEVVVSLEDLTSLEQQAAEGTLPPVGAAADEAEEEEEEITGGKGRTFLKICLVILVILLVIEVAGVAIKIAAPTSGAANFIDNQLEKVFQLIGDEDTDPAVLSADNDFEA